MGDRDTLSAQCGLNSLVLLLLLPLCPPSLRWFDYTFFSCFFCWSVLINARRHATKFNIHDHTNPRELNTTKNQQLRVLSALNLLFFVTAMRYHSQISLRTWEGVYQANRTSIIQFIDHHLRQNFHAKAELQVLKLTHKDTRREKKIQSVFFIDSSNQSESTFYAWAHPVLIVF